jgi:hypothetical protein
VFKEKLGVQQELLVECHELSQSRYKSRIRWVTTCTIGSSRYKNLKLGKERERLPTARGRSYIAPYGSYVAHGPSVGCQLPSP